jgi:molybdate transport system permease protein
MQRVEHVLKIKLMLGLFGSLALLLIVMPIIGLAWRVWREEAWRSANTEPVTAALRLSLETTTITATIILLIGTPLAYGLTRWQSRGQVLVNALVELPIVMPPAVAGLGLLMAFGRHGLFGKYLLELGLSIPFSMTAVVIAQTFVALPFYIRTAQVGFQSIPRYLEEAARVDGADTIAILWHITLPLARRAMLAGLLMGWARALGEFGATILFAGSLQGRTQTMPLLVYTILEQDLNAAIWTALILIGVALFVLLFTRLLTFPPKLSE